MSIFRKSIAAMVATLEFVIEPYHVDLDAAAGERIRIHAIVRGV